jgi:hypothetical protein
LIVLASLILAAAVAWAARHVAVELRATRDEASRARVATLLDLFAAARAAAQNEPRALLVWQPIASMARQLFPAECAVIDQASGGAFPFTSDQIQAAHAQWTADWLAWERMHDGEYKLKAAQASSELAAAGDSEVARGKVDAIEREKLDRYQRRYAEYVRVSKGLRALM